MASNNISLISLENSLKNYIGERFDEVNKNLTEFRGYVGNQLTEVKSRMDLLENLTSNNETTININRKDLDALTEEVQNLKSACTDLRSTTNTVEMNLDDSINRSMRSTLIFRGIPEHDKTDNSWEQATQSLINTLNELHSEKFNIVSIKNDIERCHRSGKISVDNDNPRVILLQTFILGSDRNISRNLHFS